MHDAGVLGALENDGVLCSATEIRNLKNILVQIIRTCPMGFGIMNFRVVIVQSPQLHFPAYKIQFYICLVSELTFHVQLQRPGEYCKTRLAGANFTIVFGSDAVFVIDIPGERKFIPSAVVADCLFSVQDLELRFEEVKSMPIYDQPAFNLAVRVKDVAAGAGNNKGVLFSVEVWCEVTSQFQVMKVMVWNDLPRCIEMLRAIVAESDPLKPTLLKNIKIASK